MPSIKVKSLPIPLEPPFGIAVTATQEAFEGIREHYMLREEPIPQSELKWYYDQLEADKNEMTDFWSYCTETAAIAEAVLRGEDELGIMMVAAQAKKIQKVRPISESDIGEMPSYGTPEFWSWCRKRKQLKLQKEAAEGSQPKKALKKTQKAPKPQTSA